MRFFIALEIPEESREQLLEVQQKLKNLFPEIRLTYPDKFHLTLAFIGEQPQEIRYQLISVLKNAASGIPSFTVTPAYLDGFPHLHSAHTLWVGVKGDVDKLMIIRERIKDGLKDLHMPVDQRRFEPHITIAKDPRFTLSEEQERHVEEIMMQPFEPIKITSLKLFNSVPSEDFHEHNTLAEIFLLD